MVEDHGVRRVILSAPTSNDIRETMLEGESGLFNAYPPNHPNRPFHVISQGTVKWPNGAKALLIPYESLERSRGPNSAAIWVDEAGSFGENGADFIENLSMGLRIYPSQMLITTTPRATPLIIDLYKRKDQDVRLVIGTTFDNESNLDERMLKRAKVMMNTPLGRQEILGELALENAAALWTPNLIENCLRPESDYPVKLWEKAVIALDPSANRPKSDLTGICIAIKTSDDKVFILKDLSGTFSSDQWVKLVSKEFDELSEMVPTVVTLESNGVGATWEEILQKQRPDIPIKPFHSSKNKFSRLGQASLLYETGQVFMNKDWDFSEMQKEMTTYTGKTREKSPDRADAMAFAVNELMYKKQDIVRSREFLF